MGLTVESRETNDEGKLGVKLDINNDNLRIEENSNETINETHIKQLTPYTESHNGTSAITKISGDLIQPSTSPIATGNIAITGSENIQFGNNTYFHGPVTIIQNKTSIDNSSHTKTQDEATSSRNENNKSDPLKKTKFQKWHKLSFITILFITVGGITALVLEIQNRKSVNSKNQVTGHSSTDVLVLDIHQLNIGLLAILIVVYVLLLLFLYPVQKIETITMGAKVTKFPYSNEFSYHTEKDDPLVIARSHLRIVSRSDWLAEPAKHPLMQLQKPVPWVIITHTATESCSIQSECVLRVRLIQTFHKESRGWDDIGYNFLVGGDGSAYEGRGWDSVGAHTKGYNIYSIAIAFIGTFNTDPPPKRQFDACKKLIELGVHLGKLSKNYKIFAHRQLMSTLSPGQAIYDVIKEWPHFVKNATTDELEPNFS